MEVMPFLVAKRLWRKGKSYEPGDIIFLGKEEAAHLSTQRMIGIQVRKTEVRTDKEIETGAVIQPETRIRRGRPPKHG